MTARTAFAMLAAATTLLAAGPPARAKSPFFYRLQRPAELLSPTPGGPHKFISGLNLGYLYDDYGFDLGPNVVEPRVHYFNSSTYHNEQSGTAVSLLKNTGGNVTRRFVFAGAQGLTFDPSGYVLGVNPVFVRNLENELSRVRAAGLSEMLVLLVPSDDAGISNVNILGNHIASGGTLQDYYIPGDAQNALISNGIGTLADTLHRDGYDSAVFAYEVINEFNEAADNGVFAGHVSFNDNYTNANNMVAAASQRIRASGYPGYVTVSTINFYASYTGGTSGISDSSIDFFDLHEYNGDGSLPTLDPNGIPVVLGEAGDNGASDDLSQAQNLVTFATNAVTQGYAGFLPWYLGSSRTDVGNVFSYIVRDGAGPASRNVRPAYRVLQNFNHVLNVDGALH